MSAGSQIRSQICIVGDGAVGKAAALGLSQLGMQVTLLSAAPPRAESSASLGDWDVRVFALNHVARNLLDGLKVWGALDASRVAPVSAMRVFDGSERATGDLSFDAYGAYINELAWIVEDCNLTRALETALRFAPHIASVYGQASRLEVGTDAATVHLSDGRQLQAELVIGADGAQSWVRGQADIGLDYRSYHQQGVVCNFECEKAASWRGTSMVCARAGHHCFTAFAW